jgi:hypothetical protein
VDPSNKPTPLRDVSPTAKAGVAPGVSQTKNARVLDLKAPDTVAGISLSTDGRMTEHPALPDGGVGRGGNGGAIDEPRSGVLLPDARNAREDNFIDHLRIVREERKEHPGQEPRGHYSVLWVERPDEPRPPSADGER